MNKKLLLGLVFMFLIVLVSNSVSASLTDGIVSYWKLDNTNLDELGLNNGTNTPLYDLGKINNGTKSNITEYMSITTTNIPTGASSVRSFNMWVKVPISSTTQTNFFAYGSQSSGQFFGIYKISGTHNWGFSQWGDTINSNFAIDDNNWHMITLVFDGTNITLYSDGNYSNSKAVSTLSGGFNTASGSTGRIGYIGNIGGSVLDYIDEVAVWNRTLSDTEITELYELYNSGTGYPFSTNFTITTNLNDYNVTMVSNETLQYNASSYTITTEVDLTDKRLWNITIERENYITQTYTDYNISLNGSISTTLILQKYNITFIAEQLMTGDLIYPFNITLNNGSIYNVIDNTTLIELDYGLYDNMTFSKTDYYNLTIYNQTIDSDKNITFEDVYNNKLTLTQMQLPYNTSLTNFSGYIYQINNDYNVSFNTSTNQTTINLIQDYNYTIYVNPTSLYSSYTTNVSINSTTTDLFVYVYRLSSIFISFYDELNFSLMNFTNITLEVIDDGFGYETNTLNGTIYLVNLTPNEYILRYSAENYTTRERIVTVVGTDYEVLSLYMVSNSSTNHQEITFNVRDYTDNNIENADVKALKYDITTGNYIYTDSCRTNFLGQCTMFLEFGTEYYKLQVEYETETMLTTSPTYITSTSYVLRIDVGEDYTSDYFNFMDIDASLVYNNDTNNFRLTYNDNNDLASNFCLYVYSFRYLEKTFEGSSCSQTSSGTVLVPITPLNGTYYVAYAYYNTPQIFLISASYEVPLSEEFSTQGIFLQILLTIVFAVASLKFIEFTGLSVSFSLILGKLMNLNTLGWEAIIGILVASIVIIFVLRRDK